MLKNLEIEFLIGLNREFPESGRVVPEFHNVELREVIMSKYRIVYRIYSPEQIVILRIILGSKLLT